MSWIICSFPDPNMAYAPFNFFLPTSSINPIRNGIFLDDSNSSKVIIIVRSKCKNNRIHYSLLLCNGIIFAEIWFEWMFCLWITAFAASLILIRINLFRFSFLLIMSWHVICEPIAPHNINKHNGITEIQIVRRIELMGSIH